MGDNWDDSGDEWDVDEDALDEKLGLKKVAENLPTFDDEEDLAVKEKEEQDKAEQVNLKKKGNALAERKRAEKERQEEIELARKAMELEADIEKDLSPDELRALKQKQIEDADHALTDDLFGNIDSKADKAAAVGGVAQAGDRVVMNDLKDHLKHARKVAESLRGHGKVHFATSFFKELLNQSKEVMTDDSVSELIKTLNVIKNEKVQASKRKVKGQAQKAKKVDKVAEAKARKIQMETFGDNDQFDSYDVIGDEFEDQFF